MLAGALALMVAVVAVSAGVAGGAIATGLVPFREVRGCRLGMTVAKAKAGIGDDCPTLTRQTRRYRGRSSCYFDELPIGNGDHELIYASLVKRCGADATLHKGRVLEITTRCPVSTPSGAG